MRAKGILNRIYNIGIFNDAVLLGAYSDDFLVVGTLNTEPPRTSAISSA